MKANSSQVESTNSKMSAQFTCTWINEQSIHPTVVVGARVQFISVWLFPISGEGGLNVGENASMYDTGLQLQVSPRHVQLPAEFSRHHKYLHKVWVTMNYHKIFISRHVKSCQRMWKRYGTSLCSPPSQSMLPFDLSDLANDKWTSCSRPWYYWAPVCQDGCSLCGCNIVVGAELTHVIQSSSAGTRTSGISVFERTGPQTIAYLCSRSAFGALTFSIHMP